ncbi:sensor histidine kinase [Streptosporangium sp. KLBMP 9127]|nr:HAMP domain-containing histidine kinase [Streptosporangium sp. KLBMP 9127]
MRTNLLRIRGTVAVAALAIAVVFLVVGLVMAGRHPLVTLGVALPLLILLGALAWWLAGRTLHGFDETTERLARAMERERRFASDASHELRTPLTGLRTGIEVALADPTGSDPWQALREALRGSERLQAVMDDLLALSRLDAGDLPEVGRVDLADLARTVVAQTPVRMPVSTHLVPGLAVPGDRTQLARLLSDLLSNAERHAESSIAVVVTRVAGEAVLEVSDDGTGIPPAERERVFERFTRLDTARSRDEGGTGLGLALAREIAAAHRGRLAIEEPAVGQGARFVLRLPLSDD